MRPCVAPKTTIRLSAASSCRLPGGEAVHGDDTSDRHRVRTKAFRFPVDIVWVDGDHRVVHMVERAEPCSEDPCPAYGPPSVEARYIIETAVGLIKQEQLQPGTELKFTLRL
jgi:uncharacterized protein